MNTNYSNLISDTESNEYLERIKEQVEAEAIAWTADYHAAGKKGAELSESDLQTVVARRWAQYCMSCRS